HIGAQGGEGDPVQVTVLDLADPRLGDAHRLGQIGLGAVLDLAYLHQVPGPDIGAGGFPGAFHLLFGQVQFGHQLRGTLVSMPLRAGASPRVGVRHRSLESPSPEAAGAPAGLVPARAACRAFRTPGNPGSGARRAGPPPVAIWSSCRNCRRRPATPLAARRRPRTAPGPPGGRPERAVVPAGPARGCPLSGPPGAGVPVARRPPGPAGSPVRSRWPLSGRPFGSRTATRAPPGARLDSTYPRSRQ